MRAEDEAEDEEHRKHRAKLEAQLREAEEATAKTLRQMRLRAALDEKLSQTLPKAMEASAIARELEKPFVFIAKVLAKSEAAMRAKDEDGDGIPDAPIDETDADVYACVVATQPVTAGSARVRNTYVTRWTLPDFTSRLEAMRSLFRAFCDNGHSVRGRRAGARGCAAGDGVEPRVCSWRAWRPRKTRSRSCPSWRSWGRARWRRAARCVREGRHCVRGCR